MRLLNWHFSYKLTWAKFIVLCLCLFWIALPLLGLPPANDADDFIFIGPALDLAHGRPMSAHHLSDAYQLANISPDRWFSFPPIYQQILGAWLYIFGISQSSMHWFQTALNLGITLALLSLFRRFKIPIVWAIPPLLILAAAEIRDWGMRPELLGIMLLVWGGVLFLRKDRPFGTGACLIAAGLVLQQAGIYSGPLWLIALYRSFDPDKCSPNRLNWRYLIAFIAGSSIPVLLFLWGIGGEIREFLRVYCSTLQSAGGMAESRWDILKGYWTSATVGWEWMRLLAIAPLVPVIGVGFFKLRKSIEGWILGTLLFGILTNLWIVHTGAYRISFIYVLLAIAGFCLLGAWSHGTPVMRLGLAIACPAVVAGLCLPFLIAYLTHPPSNGDEIRNVLSKANWARIYMDANAAAIIFDWHLPEGAQSLRDCKGYSLKNIFGPRWAEAAPQIGELYLIEQSDYQGIPLRILGRSWNSIHINRWQWDVVDYQGVSLLSGQHVGFPGATARAK